ncbi:MAG TPA: alpha/beta hydrolase [Candidatus Acidoferrales bacterium]|jgi:hypothetical protein|nr:alpha/beta hydrolase [Candidatus Acidoferrales bacterium]
MDWFLDLRAWGRGGPVGTLKVSDGTKFYADATSLLNAIRGRDVFLMAHGYHVDRDRGIQSLSQWKSKLAIGAQPIFIGILWPGDCILPIFVDYVWEGSEAETSGTMVGEFVRDNFASAASWTFASHSLGARVVLQAIQTLADSDRVRNLILLAAAIEDDTLLHEFNGAANKVDRISVVYSWEDHVLQLAYPGGNLIGGLIERGDPNVKAALGRLGPSAAWPGKIVPNPRLPSYWKYGHTDYLTTDQVPGDFTVPIKIYDPDAQQLPSGMLPVLAPNDTWKPCWSPAFAATQWLVP